MYLKRAEELPSQIRIHFYSCFEINVYIFVVVWPQPATKDHMAALSPFPQWGREENRTKKAKLVGRDKGSLTEQQSKRTVAATVLIKRIYKTREYTGHLSHRPTPSALPRAIHLPPASFPHSAPSMVARGIEYPVGLASLRQLAQLCPLPACENQHYSTQFSKEQTLQKITTTYKRKSRSVRLDKPLHCNCYTL